MRYGAADFAPTPEQVENIDDGPNGAGHPGSGEIHVIPVAGAAITVVVHFPEGCGLKTQDRRAGLWLDHEKRRCQHRGRQRPDRVGHGGQFSNQTIRVHIKDQTLEEIWQGQVTKWGEIVKETQFETDWNDQDSSGMR